MNDDRKKFLKNIDIQYTRLGKSKKILKESLNFSNQVNFYDYSYLWTWFGVPIIQNPTEILVNQEIIFKIRPDVIIETGIARGGSLIFYASILSLLKKKFQVIGVDIDLRKHNRDSLNKSKFSKSIKIINGSSTEKKTFVKIKKLIKKNSKVLVILDSDHSKNHVYEECKSYSTLVSNLDYLVSLLFLDILMLIFFPLLLVYVIS